MLIYETDDSDFADSAIGALTNAGIDAYRTGGAALYTQSDPTICIHIRDAADFSRANELLIKLGAATDDPDRFPPRWVFAVGVVAAVALALWITSVWK